MLRASCTSKTFCFLVSAEQPALLIYHLLLSSFFRTLSLSPFTDLYGSHRQESFIFCLGTACILLLHILYAYIELETKGIAVVFK